MQCQAWDLYSPGPPGKVSPTSTTRFFFTTGLFAARGCYTRALLSAP
jgi:hypothetical protein